MQRARKHSLGTRKWGQQWMGDAGHSVMWHVPMQHPFPKLPTDQGQGYERPGKLQVTLRLAVQGQRNAASYPFISEPRLPVVQRGTKQHITQLFTVCKVLHTHYKESCTRALRGHTQVRHFQWANLTGLTLQRKH